MDGRIDEAIAQQEAILDHLRRRRRFEVGALLFLVMTNMATLTVALYFVGVHFAWW